VSESDGTEWCCGKVVIQAEEAEILGVRLPSFHPGAYYAGPEREMWKPG
jgi:hypothetical protein